MQDDKLGLQLSWKASSPMLWYARFDGCISESGL